MRRSPHRASIIACIVFAVRVAAAQTPAQVETLHDIGTALRQGRRDELALRAFELANELAPEPRAVTRIAQAEMATRRWLDAETHLTQALQNPQDPWVQEHHAQIDRALAEVRTHLGLLRVRCSVEGARVWLGTTNLGRANGAVLRSPAGSAELEVRAEGYRTSRVRVNVPAGNAAADLQVTLVPLTAPPAAPGAPESLSTAPESQRVSPPPSRSAGPWVLVGVGAVAMVGYFVLDFGLRPSAVDSFNALCPNGVCPPSRFNEAAGYSDEAATYATLARVSLGVGAVLTTAGIVWAVVRSTTGASAALEPAVSIGASSAALALNGRF